MAFWMRLFIGALLILKVAMNSSLSTVLQDQFTYCLLKSHFVKPTLDHEVRWWCHCAGIIIHVFCWSSPNANVLLD
ncbi:hypothetical protein AAHA92_18339 [Salvia divinorum]|uniref:Secreted protein n=1 Tax=Salvia divinorum TaxID=28513 RepID=A0ABD1H1T5_SALDI